MNIQKSKEISDFARFKQLTTDVFRSEGEASIPINPFFTLKEKQSLKEDKNEYGADQVKVLIVDDLKDNLLALEAILRRDGIKIFQAKSGNEALDLLILHGFALAIIDVQMPGMSGFELAELMRGAKRTKNIPIIFVTATAHAQSFVFKGYESGAVDFLLKPLDTHAVKSKVNIFIELFQRKQELKTQLATNTSLMADLKIAKIEAENANESKTQFLANMSHEIRTPIGAVVGFAKLLLNPNNSTEENCKYMHIIERNSQQLLRLIDDILDLSKVEAGKVSIENMEFSLAEMLSDSIAVMDLRAQQKGIKFHFITETLIPDLICADPFRLKQVLNNIVGNAIKFTDVGSVELKISFANSTLQFSVKDTGPGISKDQASRLFLPFSQADTSTTRKFGGTGLGLVLSRHLSELLGGKLVLLKSEEGQGSTFLVEVNAKLLPNAKLVGREALTVIAATSPVLHSHDKVLQGLRVLLVEDSLDNQLLINFYLGEEGAQVKLALDGVQGIELALAEEFDIVLMDIQMPNLDGHEATKKLRKLNYLKPIVALTAYAMKEEQVKCHESGFNEFLTKPIQRELLIERLSHYARLACLKDRQTSDRSK